MDREATEDILLGKGMLDHYDLGDYATVVWVPEEPDTMRFRKFPIGAALFSAIMFGLWFWVKGIRTD